MSARKRHPAWNLYSASAVAAGFTVALLFLSQAPGAAYGWGVFGAALITDLGFTLAERRRRKRVAQAPVPDIVRTPRLIELAAAETHLLALRSAYSAGRTSGHPEDSLWDIEDAEKRVARLRSGTD